MSRKKKIDAVGVNVPAPEMVKLSEVNFAPYNPRVMSSEQMAALKASLVRHGMVLNLVVQREGMILIGGHQRVAAMRELCKERGWEEPEEVPAVILDVRDSAAKELNVALNKIDGEFDPYRLGELFASIKDDLSLEAILATGFDPESINQAIALTSSVEELAGALEQEAASIDILGFGRSITLSVEFETVEERDQAKELLKKLSDGVKPGSVLMKALKAADVSGKAKKEKVKKSNGASARQ